MADYLYNVLYHVMGVGTSNTFERGEPAMRLAKDLESVGYVVKVRKRRAGNAHGEEVIYESDDWIPPAEAEEDIGYD